MKKQSPTRFIIVVCSLLASILYSSWIVGYLVNPLVARGATVSELAAFYQPLRMVFIAGDILMAMIVLFLAVYVHINKLPYLKGLALPSVLGFGLFSAFSAVTTLSCLPSIVACGGEYFKQRYELHNVFGLIASTCLAVSVYVVAHQTRKDKDTFSSKIILLLAVWTSIGGGSYALIVSNVGSNTINAILQRVFLVGTAILLFLVLSKRIVDKNYLK